MLDLHPTADQLEILESANTYLLNELPAARLPHQAEQALSQREWRGLAEMGWFALGLPEEAGGLGLSVIEESLIAREFGRHLVPPAALATMLAAHAAHGAGNDDLVTGLASGRFRAGFALPEKEGRWRLLDSAGADVFLAWLPDRTLLIARDAFAAAETVPALDASLQTMTAAGLDGNRVQVFRDNDRSFGFRARVLIAAALTGGAEAVRDLSAEYAKVRQQFGRSIGEFQAISHRCAAMAVNAEAALSLMQYAAVSARDGSPEADMYTAAAMIVAGDAAYDAAGDSMQIHGGYGQTYEYLPHFYLKRAILYRLLGDGDALRGSVLDAATTL